MLWTIPTSGKRPKWRDLTSNGYAIKENSSKQLFLKSFLDISLANLALDS